MDGIGPDLSTEWSNSPRCFQLILRHSMIHVVVFPIHVRRPQFLSCSASWPLDGHSISLRPQFLGPLMSVMARLLIVMNGNSLPFDGQPLIAITGNY